MGNWSKVFEIFERIGQITKLQKCFRKLNKVGQKISANFLGNFLTFVKRPGLCKNGTDIPPRLWDIVLKKKFLKMSRKLAKKEAKRETIKICTTGYFAATVASLHPLETSKHGRRQET